MPEILTKEQLQDAIKCNDHYCDECKISRNTNRNCVEQLAQTALAYREMLEKLEHTEKTIDDYIRDIEAQQLEIEKLNKSLMKLVRENMRSRNLHLEEVRKVVAMTAEKDELAGRLMRLSDGIKQAIKWLTPHPSDGSRAVEKARLHLIALIGGKDDA